MVVADPVAPMVAPVAEPDVEPLTPAPVVPLRDPYEVLKAAWERNPRSFIRGALVAPAPDRTYRCAVGHLLHEADVDDATLGGLAAQWGGGMIPPVAARTLQMHYGLSRQDVKDIIHLNDSHPSGLNISEVLRFLDLRRRCRISWRRP